MDSILGVKNAVPPDIGEISKSEDIEKNEDMLNINEDGDYESVNDDRADHHGPIKTGKQLANEKLSSFEIKNIRKQRLLSNVEKKKIAKSKYDAKMAMNTKTNVSVGKDSVMKEDPDQSRNITDSNLPIPNSISTESFVYERRVVEQREHEGLPLVIDKRMVDDVVVGNYQH